MTDLAEVLADLDEQIAALADALDRVRIQAAAARRLHAFQSKADEMTKSEHAPARTRSLLGVEVAEEADDGE